MTTLTRTDDELDQVFKALADPTRRSIVHRLTGGDATVNELSEPFNISGPAISRHLKVLERAGLITRSVNGQTRPCHLKTETLDDALEWMSEQRRIWDERLDRLDKHLDAMQHPTRTTP